jgi:hypothetical protein
MPYIPFNGNKKTPRTLMRLISLVRLIFLPIKFLRFTRLKINRAAGGLRWRLVTNVVRTRYAACWTEDDGIYFCGHKHETLSDAMKCLVPDGGSFVRAFESGLSRSLNETEYQEFLAILRAMPWSRSKGEKQSQ